VQGRRLSVAESGGKTAEPLDKRILKEALAAVLACHEALHTRFESLPGMEYPIQVTDPSVGLSCREFDLRTESDERLASLVKSHLAQESAADFDLRLGPPIRFRLLELSESECVLLICAHPLCADGRTIVALAGHIAVAYDRLIRGEEPPGHDVQYVQFAEWQNEIFEDEIGKEGNQYWNRQLLVSNDSLSLPFEKSLGRVDRAGRGPFSAGAVELAIPADVAEDLNATALRENSSVSAQLLSAFQVLLFRLTGSSEIGIHVLFECRQFEELRGACGLFAKYIPIHCRLNRHVSFGELRGKTDSALEESEKWEEYYRPDTQVAHFDTDRGADLILFDFLDWRSPDSSDSLRLIPLSHEVCQERYKLRVSGKWTGEGLKVVLSYDEERYEREGMERLGGHYLELLRRGMREPCKGVGRLEMFSAGARREVLEEVNEGLEEQEEGEGSMQEAFEREVERVRDAVAVTKEGEHLSYEGLNERAERMAGRLIRMGVGAEEVVGICVGRGIEQVVGLMGVIKSGGAYVAIDPGQGEERIRYMLEDAKVRVLICDEQTRGPKGWTGEVVRMEELDEEVEEGGSRRGRSGGRNLGYLMYTSGTTGRPKGVMIEQRGVMNLLQGLERRVYGSHRQVRRVSLNAPVWFDASVKQLMQLMRGRTIVVVGEEERRDGRALLERIEREGVEVLDCTPSQLRMLLEAGMERVGGAKPEVVLVGGEDIDEETWREMRGSGVREYYNVYGPTECTVDATLERVRGQQGERGGEERRKKERSNIGRPLLNTMCYVLDEEKELRPVGMKGELYIGGRGVGRGYKGKEEMTAESFVPDEYSGEKGGRMYATGDVVTYDQEKRLEYVGRLDEQIKLRGYRIEPGEIERVMEEHPWVEQALVLVSGGERGGGELVAYVKRRRTGVGAMRRAYKMSGKMEVIGHNANETRYLYEEIFERESYMKHGIEIGEESVVVDVGANIGLFSIYAARKAVRGTVLAIEPIKEIYETLRMNVEHMGVKTIHCGIGREEKKEEEWVYYRGYTMMSGKREFADAEAEKEVIGRYLANERQRGIEEGELDAEEVVGWRFEGERRVSGQRRMREVIEEEGLERIDLLKIDVQRAELEVLEGIGEGDWGKIGQIVMEVHDGKGEATEGRLEEVRELLEGRGYRVETEQDELLVGTDRYTMYAVKREGQKGERGERRRGESKEGGEVVVNSVEEGRVERIRAWLRRRVPEYMMPLEIIEVEEYPLTSNGKVDRRRLQEVTRGLEEEAPEKSEARGEYEEIMQSIWSEVLGREVGVEQSFFEAGGHSLLATQVMSRVREAFGVALPLRALFEEETIRRLSKRVEKAKKVRDEGGREREKVERVSGRTRERASFAQERLWVIEQMGGPGGLYNCPKAVRMKRTMEAEKLERAVKRLAERHEILRTRYDEEGGELWQVIDEGCERTIGFENREARGEEEARQIIEEEARKGFDLRNGPILRLTVIQEGEASTVLMLTIHHIASDDWSMGLMLNELNELYEEEAREASGGAGEQSREDEKEERLQYADYARWQRATLTGSSLDDLLDYWKTRLGGELPVMKLPVKSTRPAVPSPEGRRMALIVPQELADRVKIVSRENRVTSFMTLLSAFNILMHRNTAQDDILVGTVMANRNRVEFEKILGFFVNTVVLRTDLSGNPTFREVMRRTRDVVLQAYAHQDLPFEKLVQELNPERAPGQTPLFQVMFAHQDAPLAGGSDLSLGNVESETKMSRFDLSLIVTDTHKGLLMSVDYKTDLFDEATITRMLHGYRNLIDEAVQDPDRRISDLRMLAKTETAGLLPSQFPNADLTQRELENLLMELEGS
jgi:amino acid adenylation domain-containing protein/FkbM family methyltransferase